MLGLARQAGFALALLLCLVLVPGLDHLLHLVLSLDQVKCLVLGQAQSSVLCLVLELCLASVLVLDLVLGQGPLLRQAEPWSYVLVLYRLLRPALILVLVPGPSPSQASWLVFGPVLSLVLAPLLFTSLGASFAALSPVPHSRVISLCTVLRTS